MCVFILPGSCTTKGKYPFCDSAFPLPVRCLCLSIQGVSHGQQNGTFKALKLNIHSISNSVSSQSQFQGKRWWINSMNYPEMN